MKGEGCYFGKHFSKKTCEKILDLGLKKPHQEATLGVDGNTVDNNWRKSKIRFIQSSETEFEFLFDAIWKMGIQANREWFNFHVTNLSYIQLAEYDSSYQGEYKKHHDVFWINKDNYHRKLTCVIQLSDPNDYEGGDFEMFDLTGGQYPNKEDLRQQGTAIFIPSFTPHQAHPVTKGTRYSIAVWLEGPKWV
jgi:PKHD-type hydroxylase